MKWLGLWLCTIACSSPSADHSVEKPGAYAVGTKRIEASSYVMQAWYPTDATVTDVPIEELEAEPRRTTYRDLLAAAPDCPSRTLPVALDGAPLAGPFPLVVLSHCHSCTRLSNASTAIRLASHGFVALSIDHTGDTLWDELAGHSGSLDAAGLQRRVDDITFALSMPPESADMSKIGILGHSFGGVTAGRVAQIDSRIVSAASLAAPMENPLIPGVMLAEIHKPVWFLVAKEDNSITEFGNKFIRDNYTAAPDEAWKMEVSDAGHWSVSDLAGLTTMFAPGCGEGVRQTDDTAFTYLDPVVGRDITASYVTAFFKATLEDDAGARAYLDGEFFQGKVAIDHHE